MKNPFIINGRIPEPYFCDRREESKKIIRTVTNGGNLCLISPRRMGKSKLISFCYDKPELADTYYTFYIDILHTTSLRELTYLFGQTVFEVLRRQSSNMLTMLIQGLKSINAKFGFDPMTNLPTFSLELGDIVQPEFTLNEIFACLEQADKPCIVAFDEFQQITYYPESNIEALLRGHIQRLGNVHFIFSGSERHIVSEMFLSSAKPFYNSATMLQLNAIALSEYIPFVTRCFGEKNISIDETLIHQVYQLFEGNTYYMQHTFHEAFIDLEKGETCSLTLLQKEINLLLEDAGNGYRQMLSRIPERQKEMLYAIAKEGRAQKVLSAAFIRKYALASASAVQSALKKLIELELVSMEDGAYFISDVLFRMYLLQLRDSNVVFI